MYLRTSHVLIGLSIFAALWIFWPPAEKMSSVPTAKAAIDASVQPPTAQGQSKLPQNATVAKGPGIQLKENQKLELPPMPALDLPLAMSQLALVQRAQAGDLPAAMKFLRVTTAG